MLLGLDGLNYKRKIAMTEPTKEQVWKEEARKAYRDQQTQDNEGGCREPIGFVQGYLAAKKSDFEEIEALKEQIAEAVGLLRYVQHPKNTDEWVDCGKEVDKFLEKQDKDKQGEG